MWTKMVAYLRKKVGPPLADGWLGGRELPNITGLPRRLAFVTLVLASPTSILQGDRFAPGRKLRGDTVFALKDVKGDVLDLTYSEPFKSGQAIWQIKL